MVLGGGLIVWDGDRRKKGYSEACAAAFASGEPLVTRAEADVAEACASAVLSDPVVKENGLIVGETEVPLEWDWNGLQFGTRGLDVVGHGRLSDLKTCRNAEPRALQRDLLGMGVHAQLALYRIAARLHGYRVDSCWVPAVETRPPYAVTCLQLSEEILREGEKLLMIWTERLKACMATGVYPSYVQSPVKWEAGEYFGFTELEDE